MLIDFSKIEETSAEKFKGGEGIFRTAAFSDGTNKIMRACLDPGASIGLHTHDSGSEIIYILKGRGKFLFDGEYSPISQGQCHYCPKGHSHSLINDGSEPLLFFAVVAEQ